MQDAEPRWAWWWVEEGKTGAGGAGRTPLRVVMAASARGLEKEGEMWTELRLCRAAFIGLAGMGRRGKDHGSPCLQVTERQC